MVGGTQHPHDQVDLFLFVVAREEGSPNVQFGDEAGKAPHIDRRAVLCPEDDLRGAIEAGLDVEKMGLVGEHAGAEVDQLNAHLRSVFQQDVLRFDVRVKHRQLCQESQR